MRLQGKRRLLYSAFEDCNKQCDNIVLNNFTARGRQLALRVVEKNWQNRDFIDLTCTSEEMESEELELTLQCIAL